MYVNKLKEKLNVGKEMGTMIFLKGYAPFIEIAGIAGVDSVLIDAEHSTLSQGECENLIRACEAVGIVPFVRSRNNDQALILRYLDAGAMGVLIPNVRTVEDARRAVKNVKYYPLGERGLSITRASDWGMKMPLSEYVSFANEQTMIFLMVENKEAVDNLEDILAVDGIDGMMIGTTDLSQSLGFPGNSKEPIVEEYVKKATDIALKSGKILGSMLRKGETFQEYFNLGYRLLDVDALGFIKEGVMKIANEVEDLNSNINV